MGSGPDDRLIRRWPRRSSILLRLGWCADLGLEKFFDRVNHDKLMGQIGKRVGDKRLLKLIRVFLNAGGDGKRVGKSEQGRDTSGRSTFATVK